MKKMIDYAVLKKDFILVNIAVGIAVLLTLLFMVLQRTGVIPGMSCTFYETLHIYCPGCGGTRAVFALMEGRLWTSLYCNPAVVLGAVLILHYEMGVIVTLYKKNGRRYYCNNPVLVILYAVIVVTFFVVRNYLLIVQGYDMLQNLPV